ncbi:MAG: PEP-CTERM-box response regulator transcription factor, partial [Geminicoccaceae bacterium]
MTSPAAAHDGGIARGPILLVDSNTERRREFGAFIPDAELLEAGDRATALMLLQQRDPLVALIDLGLSPDPVAGSDGSTVIEAILAVAPFTKVLAIAGAQRTDHAILAIGAGAWDCLMQPVPADLLRGVVDRALAVASLEREHRRRAALGTGVPDFGMLGESQAIVAVRRQIARVAPTDVSVIIGGESGTGKEVAARALHAGSPRRGRRFVPINCAAIPEMLLESELFGYERGAFTGAVKQSPGRIELANGGTLFLDEIGDLPLGLQAKLLRFLQERVIERIGGRQEIPVDVRVVCATHRDLGDLMREGRFREDLYYRLAEIALHLPPLRERDGDAVLMAKHFLAQYAGQHLRPNGYTADALEAIDSYRWPGNVRELQNRVKRAVIMVSGPRITAQNLDLPVAGEPTADLNLRRRRDELVLSVLRRALARSGGNLSVAA